MSTSTLETLIEKEFAILKPGAKVLSSRLLTGGISATMTAFEIYIPDVGVQKVIARQPGRHRTASNPDAATKEFQILQALYNAGLPVQRPYFLEKTTDGAPASFYVVEYIEGQPEVRPEDVSAYLEKYAEQLAQIHRTDWAFLNLSGLPTQRRGFGRRPEILNESLREGAIRDALESVSPFTASNAPVLRHGDFWPGNVLWRNAEIVGVIDWEEALIGEPLADLAICRLDLWWVFGEAAAHEFTDLYRRRFEIDLRDLPYWDLCASLRPISNIEQWASSYPGLGRPDVTEMTMRRDHRAFVAQALEEMKKRSVD